MLRGIFNAVALVVLTIIGSLASILVGPFTKTGDPVLAFARVWGRWILRVAGVQLETQIRTPLSRDQVCVLMSNHLSMVDIWALFVAIPIPIRFIAKKQLGWIPLFGWAMKAGRFIFIDRENAVRARRSIEEAQRRIAAGTSVILFPEGTRSRDGHLGPFKKGGFHLAIGAQAPIIPVAISGAREVMPRGSPLIRPGRVRVQVGEPIPTAGLGAADRDAVLARVRAAIVEMLPEEARPIPSAAAQ